MYVGDWETAKQLMNKLPTHSIVVKEPVAKALCELIHRVIDPLYNEKCAQFSTKRKEHIPNMLLNDLSTRQVRRVKINKMQNFLF